MYSKHDSNPEAFDNALKSFGPSGTSWMYRVSIYLYLYLLYIVLMETNK